jgi:ProP effector
MTPSVPEETPAIPATATTAPEAQRPPAANPGTRGARPRGRKPPPGPGRGPAPRAPHPLLDKLAGLYPHLFGAQFRPLKIGVFQDLVSRHPEDLPKDELKVALGLHTRSTRYLESVASGQARHDLEGAATEPLAPEHVHHAIMEVFRRRQARSRQDLKPWLLERLVAAIDASGLGRDEYLERIRTSDPFALEALQHAFAEIAERSARREALQRAYQASGRSVEEFADMYGLDVATVRQAVQ